MAIQVISFIGYPQHTATILPLIELLADDSVSCWEDAFFTSIQEEALHTLSALGPQILPQIVHMAESDSAMKAVVDKAFRRAASLLVEDGSASEDQIESIYNGIIQELSESPENAIPAIVYVLCLLPMLPGQTEILRLVK